MESKKINQLATELAPDLSDLTIIGDPTTGISKKITLSQMASLFTGTVEEYANLAAFPITGVADTIYIAKDTNVIYRWDSTAYVVLSPNIIASLVFNDANGFDGTIALVGSVATLTITTALTSGSVPFIGASGALTQDNANLFFDDTNNRLGIATASPTTPLDVFGSGIIGRLNATSTNNSFLGFASNGTNKWSAGNVQSDHRFRIFSEANSAELITILQTGEFGIGIANPTTKFHIDGAASALIANLDANVSIAKSVSYRSDNSARINLEVSGTESGSNVGADFFLRTFTDAGSLLETPFTIVRSTGVTTIKSLTLTNVLSVANGGTGSATQNFVDLTSIQTAAGAKTFSAITTISNATASTSTTTGGLVVTGGVGIGGALFGTSAIFSGNVGIGVTPSSQAFSGLQSIQIKNALYFGYLNRANVLANAYITSSGGLNYIATDFATRYEQFEGKHQFSTAPSGTLDTAITFTPRLLIDNSGNVGIGTSSPANVLHVVGGNGNQMDVDNTGQRYTQLNLKNNGTQRAFFAIDQTASEFQIYGQAGFALTLGAGGGERMRITAAGNVGIGTSSPSALLHLNASNIANRGQLTIQSTDFSQITFYKGATTSTDMVAQIYTESTGSYPLNINANQAAGYIVFGAGGGTERMRITSGGNVLIGDTGDYLSSRLNLKSADSTSSTNIIACRNSSGTDYFRVRSDGYTYALGVYNNTTGSGANVFVGAGGDFLRSTSSLKYKNSIRDYDKGLDIVNQLRPVYYKGNNDGDTIFAGLIAEEVHDLGLTEFVQYAEDGSPDALAYQNMIALAFKAIQEQQATITSLQDRLDKIENK